MSDDNTQIQDTQHAFLVAWGWFAERIGLTQALQGVALHQKKYTHTPQTKVLEFLVAVLAGTKHLQDISLAAHPLDMDQAVAAAWGQPGWADYSGVSRTLSTLNWAEARDVARVLEEVSRPLIQAELAVLRSRGQRLRFDGDLTGLPVSNSSRTYPNAAFGHMDAEIRLGYQAAVVSLESPTYERLWLSIAHHPGDTVSCTQAEALVLAAEARTGLRPRRRTDLLSQRIAAFEQRMETTRQRWLIQQGAVSTAHDRLTEARQQVQERQALLTNLEEDYRVRQREERPTSQLALARKRLKTAERRCQSRARALQLAEQRLAKTQAQWDEQQEILNGLKERLARFEQDNATNPAPVEAEFRLDAGFGTYENVALLEWVTRSTPRRTTTKSWRRSKAQPARRRDGRGSGPMPRWWRGQTGRSRIAHTLWTSVWNASTPARRSSIAPCCTSVVTRSPRTYPLGSSTTTADRRSKPESRKARAFSGCIASRCVLNRPSTCRSVSSSSRPTSSAGLRTGWPARPNPAPIA